MDDSLTIALAERPGNERADGYRHILVTQKYYEESNYSPGLYAP